MKLPSLSSLEVPEKGESTTQTLATNLRIYAWAPRSEVVYIQAVIDAYEGLARVRTERHSICQKLSLLVFLVQPSREIEFRELLASLAPEIHGSLDFV